MTGKQNQIFKEITLALNKDNIKYVLEDEDTDNPLLVMSFTNEERAVYASIKYDEYENLIEFYGIFPKEYSPLPKEKYEQINSVNCNLMLGALIYIPEDKAVELYVPYKLDDTMHVSQQLVIENVNYVVDQVNHMFDYFDFDL